MCDVKGLGVRGVRMGVGMVHLLDLLVAEPLQFVRVQHLVNMSPLWIFLSLLPIIATGERFNCKGRILGAYYADYKSLCKAFHVCVRVSGGGIRDFRFYCPPGTRFTQEAQTCTDWGDDDGLACPVDYDGQFDIYKIGSGLEAKKVANPQQDEENEFSLQRAESNNRNLASTRSPPQSDLRAAHSSDFFTGQRERGKDDGVSQGQTSLATRSPYRRPPSRTTLLSIQTEKPYDSISKRKLVRKRPVPQKQKSVDYTQPPVPTTILQNPYEKPLKSVQNYNANNNFRATPETTVPTTVNFNRFDDSSRVIPIERYHIRQKSQNNNELFQNKQTNQDTGPFKITVRNNFVVSPGPDYASENDAPNKNVNVSPNGVSHFISPNYDEKNFRASTSNYNNFNSVAYDTGKQSKQEKNFNTKDKFISQNPGTTVAYSTIRVTAPPTVNNIAYKTNDAFNAQAINNYAGSAEDDGQYRLPDGEDDGQYRPELYEAELLSGAHSINIAASGNRLNEDKKLRNKIASSFTQVPTNPRPFSVPSTTTPKPVTSTNPTFYSQQTEYISSYPTTNYSPTFATTPRQTRPTTPSTYQTQRPTTTLITKQNFFITQKYTTDSDSYQETTRTPKKQNFKNAFSKPVNNKKEDSSYDYAYYDSADPYSEYDQIEEFSRTNKRT